MSPLLLAALVSSFPQSGFEVTGLKPGESFTELASTIEDAVEFDPSGHTYLNFSGRVVDAFTGEAIAGAVIETWTEELNEHVGGLYRAGEAMSGEDGRFTVARNEKARVHAPGYLIWNDAGVELFEEAIELFPDNGKVPRLRVIDTHGRPIYNAVVTSTLTCSHDVPAFEVRTNSEGVAWLRGYGPQDNMPELRLRAQGFAGTEYINAEHALLDGYELTLVMPRLERKIQAQLLQEDGNPYAFGTYHIHDGECYHVGRTNEDGHLYAPYRYLADGVMIEPLEPNAKPFGDVDLIPNRPFKLRQISWDPPEELLTAEIQISLPDWAQFDGELPEAQLIHEDGWTKSLQKKHWQKGSISFPAGKAALHLGGGFRRFAEEWLEFDAAAGAPVQLHPHWKLQPRIDLVLPEGSSLGWVEADGYTANVDARTQTLPYPKGARLVFQCWNDQNEPVYYEANAPDGTVNIVDLKDLKLVPPELRPDEVKMNKISLHLPDGFKGKSSWRANSMLHWTDMPEVQASDQSNRFTLEVAECSLGRLDQSSSSPKNTPRSKSIVICL